MKRLEKILKLNCNTNKYTFIIYLLKNYNCKLNFNNENLSANLKPIDAFDTLNI